MRALRAATFSCLLALSIPAPAAAAALEDDRVYQEGIENYSRGDPQAALASFRSVLRREPNNHLARAAVRRLEYEAAVRRAARRPARARLARAPLAPPAARAAPASPAGILEHFFLVSLPRWYYFERTIGDGLRDVGALDAANARIVQLLGERKAALESERIFENDRRLRELLRRAPLATLGRGQA